MSLTASILALAGGLAARIAKPERDESADIEITRLKAELAEAQRQLHLMRLTLMEQPAPRREIVDCTGGGRYAHLAGLQQIAAYQQQMAAQQQFSAFHAQGLQQALLDQSDLYNSALAHFSRNVVVIGE